VDTDVDTSSEEFRKKNKQLIIDCIKLGVMIDLEPGFEL
jgi:hypothetical protein